MIEIALWPSHGTDDVERIRNLLDDIRHRPTIKKYRDWAQENEIEVNFVQNRAIFESSTDAVLFRLKFKV